MKFIVLVILVLAANAAHLDEFESFKIKFNKNYATVKEEAYRRGIFKNTLETINAHNIKFNNREETFEMGINQFSDMLFEEIPLGNFEGDMSEVAEQYEAYSYDPNEELPESIDWRTKGLVTKVKDQGYCLSCWAFATVGAVEALHTLQTGKLVELSEQNLVDCSSSHDYGTHGCQGSGTMIGPMQFVKDNEGISTEDDYEYVSGNTNVASNCTQKDRPKVNIKIGNILQITNGNEQALKHAVATKGPVSAALVFPKSAKYYKSGVLYAKECEKDHSLNHAVTIVGYGVEKNEEGTDQDYWLIKNSYGLSYGVHGYLKLARNKDNLCKLASMAVIPTV